NVSNNTAAGFLLDTVYSSAALGNLLPPAGYTTSFTNALAAVQNANYRGYHELSTYDPSQCASICNSDSNCFGFNIYFQRNPSYVPNNNCINPPAATMIQCGFYGVFLNGSMTTNSASWQNNFAVVIAGSNGYNKNYAPTAVTDFTGPKALTGALGFGVSDYVAYSYFSSYDPASCASACLSMTASRRAITQVWYWLIGKTYVPCNSFNLFNLTINSVVQSYMCVLYSDAADTVDTPVTSLTLSGVSYNVSYSYAWDLYPADPG
ncbi:hypothetical protein K461DRAFT_205881, partial [Myriangium duriaei CBS 260.36]